MNTARPSCLCLETRVCRRVTTWPWCNLQIIFIRILKLVVAPDASLVVPVLLLLQALSREEGLGWLVELHGLVVTARTNGFTGLLAWLDAVTHALAVLPIDGVV